MKLKNKIKTQIDLAIEVKILKISTEDLINYLIIKS